MWQNVKICPEMSRLVLPTNAAIQAVEKKRRKIEMRAVNFPCHPPRHTATHCNTLNSTTPHRSSTTPEPKRWKLSKVGKKQKEFVGNQPKKQTQPGPAAQEWKNRTNATKQSIVHFLLLPGSQWSFTEITEYVYFSLI